MHAHVYNDKNKMLSFAYDHLKMSIYTTICTMMDFVDRMDDV